MYNPKNIMAGDILLMVSRPESPWYDQVLDAGIRWSTTNPFVHACLVGEGILINPLWHIESSPLDTYAQNGWAFHVANAVPDQRRKAVAWAMAHMGQQYGITELVADAARDDLKIPLGERWHPHYLTCSGFVSRAWREAGIMLSYAPLPSPADLSYSPLLLGNRPWLLPLSH